MFSITLGLGGVRVSAIVVVGEEEVVVTTEVVEVDEDELKVHTSGVVQLLPLLDEVWGH